MEIKIDLTPEQIDEYVRGAILNSSFGARLKEVIEEEIKKINSYDSPLRQAIRQHIAVIVNDLLRDQFKPQIEAMIAEKLTETVRQEFLDGVWDKYFNARR